MNEATTSLMENNFSATLQQIRETENLDCAIEILKKIKALKTALECVDKFEEQSIKYAVLNAEAMLRVVELGGQDMLRGHEKETAIWLYNMGEQERAKYINMCAQGATIVYVWKQEVYQERKMNEALDKVYAIRKDAIEALKQEKFIEFDIVVTEVCREFRKGGIYNGQIVQDTIDGIRHAFRSIGAVGTGKDPEGKPGIYFIPDECGYSEYMEDAVLERLDGILRDIVAVRDLIANSGRDMKGWLEMNRFDGFVRQIAGIANELNGFTEGE